jgi:hypothetical protein
MLVQTVTIYIGENQPNLIEKVLFKNQARGFQNEQACYSFFSVFIV